MVVSVQQAFEAATQCFSPHVWWKLTPAQQTRAIYDAMRRLDAEEAGVEDEVEEPEAIAT